MTKNDDNSIFAEGLTLLRRPILPLAGIVQFLYLTGDFACLQDLLSELPEPIETGGILYEHPALDLMPYLDQMQSLVDVKEGRNTPICVLDENEESLDTLNAAIALSNQRILTQELERINSLLCAPCGCQLCCVGPDTDMHQQYFEIPLIEKECALFSCAQLDTVDSRRSHPEDEPALQVDGQFFYTRKEPLLIHWRQGPSLILPRATKCPNLAESGACRIYEQRPLVCRRPQIFPYLLEQEQHSDMSTFRLRRAVLAVMDCPYVSCLQQEIADYASACELEIVFRHNKA